MKTPGHVLESVRRCLHSIHAADDLKSDHDYHCQIDIPESAPPDRVGPLCRMLLTHDCDLHEPFPESQDH